MVAKGIHIHCETIFDRIEKRGDGRLAAHLKGGEAIIADQVMLAIGRIPNTEGMGLKAAGVALGKVGEIVVDDYSRTNVANIWAVGDVTNRIQLTPVAIHEAMCFIETAFKNNPTKPDLDDVPTAVFSQPEIGTVGLSEDDAARKFSDLEIYRTDFRPLRSTLSGRTERVLMKIVVDGATRRVLGVHVMGPDAGEMAQLLGIAVKAGVTKDIFDRTMAIHPTAAGGTGDHVSRRPIGVKRRGTRTVAQNGSVRPRQTFETATAGRTPAHRAVFRRHACRSISIALSAQRRRRLTRIVPAWDSGGSSKVTSGRLSICYPWVTYVRRLMTMAHGEGRAGDVVKVCNARLSERAG
jgi:hypothetical protein